MIPLHELSITADILEAVLNEISSGNYKKVIRVDIVIGDLSGIVGDSVEYYFKLLSQNTSAADAILTFKYMKSQFRCSSCGKTYERSNFFILCPYCHGKGTMIKSCTSIYIESIEVE